MDLIKTYNPANTNITEQELSAMKDLTSADIAILAKAYPNQPTGNAYLVLYMNKKKPDDQLFPLSTWKNLDALRKMGHDDIVAYAFKKNHYVVRGQQAPPPQRVVDLSKDETDKAEGMKQVSVSPELQQALIDLQKAIDEKQHHMTIKSLQAKVDGLK